MLSDHFESTSWMGCKQCARHSCHVPACPCKSSRIRVCSSSNQRARTVHCSPRNRERKTQRLCSFVFLPFPPFPKSLRHFWIIGFLIPSTVWRHDMPGTCNSWVWCSSYQANRKLPSSQDLRQGIWSLWTWSLWDFQIWELVLQRVSFPLAMQTGRQHLVNLTD